MGNIDNEIMNSKEKKKLFLKLKEQWNTNTYDLKEKVFLKKSSGKVFLLEKETAEMLLKTNIKIYSYGNYIGTDSEFGFRTSIEGSQLIGKLSSNNIIELDSNDIRKWISGEDIDLNTDINEKNIYKGFVLIKNQNDFYGCGKKTETKILNHIPKARRIKNILE